MEQSTFLWEEPRARTSASLDFERDLLVIEARSPSSLVVSLDACAPGGWFGRTSPECFPLMTEPPSESSCGPWQSSGMGPPTAFLTLSTSEFPSAGVACSLSDILETGDVPPRYFLSATACRGILRRAAKRGKLLPPLLQAALESVE